MCNNLLVLKRDTRIVKMNTFIILIFMDPCIVI